MRKRAHPRAVVCFADAKKTAQPPRGSETELEGEQRERTGELERERERNISSEAERDEQRVMAEGARHER